ncbi:MAG: CopD family protein [Azoarcus sp.]|nr:CopD family protein [Azoarcus sp.]
MGLRHLALFLHLTGVVFWVGGMVFIRACLATSMLTGAQWIQVLERFFPLAWASIAFITLSGVFALFDTGFARAPLGWLLMAVTGSIMIAVFVSLRLGPWRDLRAALAADGQARARERAEAALRGIDRYLDIILALAAVTATAATFGLGL